MTEKRQTSQGYIILILQHFATKLRNIANFVMLFQADEIFVQTCLDQNFTQNGKGLLYYHRVTITAIAIRTNITKTTINTHRHHALA